MLKNLAIDCTPYRKTLTLRPQQIYMHANNCLDLFDIKVIVYDFCVQPPEAAIDLALNSGFDDLAMVEFLPARETQFANEIFKPIRDQSKHRYNNNNVRLNKKDDGRKSRLDDINVNAFSSLRTLAADAQKLLEEATDNTRYDRFPQLNVSLSVCLCVS